MKRLYLLVALIVSINLIHAQDAEVIETEIKVDGVCKMCKERIEKAVDIEEVRYAKWDKRDRILFVAYESTVSVDSLHKRITLAGHDTEKFKASTEDYQKLPKCCLYRDNVQTH